MSSPFITSRQIERWVPQNLGQVVGCDDLKEILYSHLRQKGYGANTLITGKTGTGKTSSVKAYVRTLKCFNRSGDPPVPCERCESCKDFDVRYAECGFHARGHDGYPEDTINFVPLNCGDDIRARVRQLTMDIRDCPGLFLVYLDEVHKVEKKDVEDLLLKPLEELEAVFIASSAKLEGLDPMFLRRFSLKAETSPPSEEQLAFFIKARCQDWSISIDRPESISALAERSDGNPNRSIRVLAHVAMTIDRQLTEGIVKGFTF